MRVLFAALFARLPILLRVIGPYAAIELLLPGGTLIALLYWWYRNRATLRAATNAEPAPKGQSEKFGYQKSLLIDRKSNRNTGPSQLHFMRKFVCMPRQLC